MKLDSPKGLKVDGLQNWTLPRAQTRRSSDIKVDGPTMPPRL